MRKNLIMKKEIQFLAQFKNQELKNILVDPIKKTPLTDQLLEENFDTETGILNLIPKRKLIESEVGQRHLELYNHVQMNGERSYNIDGYIGNFSHDKYPPSLRLAEKLLRGSGGAFLDIGCGLLNEPIYIKESRHHCDFIGIDPIAVGNNKIYKPRSFQFIQAIGDYLPFPNESFDGVVFSSTLDHHINPSKALAEANRILRKEGEIYIVETVRPLDLRFISWAIRVKIFGSAIYNHFHIWAFTKNSLKKRIEKEGFKLIETEFFDANELFIKAIKK
jgi:ubiquinone/menaquinone biosynthesis C-methylase UbiE